MTAAQLERALNWDRSQADVAATRMRESVLGGSATHDSEGRTLNPSEQRMARDLMSNKLAGLSVADPEAIRRMVV